MNTTKDYQHTFAITK